jgi:hypothetical protein
MKYKRTDGDGYLMCPNCKNMRMPSDLYPPDNQDENDLTNTDLECDVCGYVDEEQVFIDTYSTTQKHGSNYKG